MKILIENCTKLNSTCNASFPKFEFHISKNVRKKYELEDELFSITGNVVFANFQQVRKFVQKINEKRETKYHVKPGEVNGAGLLDEIFHFLLGTYENELNPGVFKRAIDHLNKYMGEEKIYKLIFEFVLLFPPMDIYKERMTIPDYLASYTGAKSNFEIVLEELILLYLANFNKANKNIIELFDENYFANKPIYEGIIKSLEVYFGNEVKIGSDNQDIFTFLKTPILNNPEDIEAQLDFIFSKWGILLKDEFAKRILSSKDLIREDKRLEFFGGGAPTVVPKYKGDIDEADMLAIGKSGYKYAIGSSSDYEETEQFTHDIDWMPRVVLMAKNVYVWLDQLSKKYQRHIYKLDQIPDEELDLLARWNFTGLWLIGLWERSGASKKIKHIMGNIDAVASAYSLYDYQVAYDLGGEEAYNNLNERAKARGIRLASDMVPNHTGIFSRWVQEHPEYFIQIDYPPFPNYKFTGADLSEDPNIQLRIEDGYWSRSDAAVTFQRIDNRTGEVKYIYHGNDGTNMPWNDTAQLNMLKAEVREAVIQKIFDVARKFSIIRFDAAMTLAKKHFSRLWYPQPGLGGDIPTRSDFALTRKEFDELFPKEFWREVVDRINEEMPDTLLLAEAFWLMEGYFVRTLGMHRVYNSAFMHMMMKEENEKYRDLITNTLEFEPEILKRYVNFMSNPDEETAVHQFGMEDKYFGIAVMMVTLPGLPMFAHGQIEGYTEKYGMEYKRAYYDESPNQWLVERHEREIFPLMQKRFLFSQVVDFWFFDFIDNGGSLNENVFAFTNTARGEKGLVFFNNKYDRTSGRIKHSVPKLVTAEYDRKEIQTKSLADALHLRGDDKIFYSFHEHISGLEYLVRGKDVHINGFHVELDGFKYKIYLDFKEIYDESGDYERLKQRIGDNGIASVSQALDKMKLKPLHEMFERIFEPERIQLLIESQILKAARLPRDNSVENILDDIRIFVDAANVELDNKLRVDKIINEIELWLDALRSLNRKKASDLISGKGKKSLELQKHINLWKKGNYNESIILFLIWVIVDQISGQVEVDVINKFQIYYPAERIYHNLKLSNSDFTADLLLTKVISQYGKGILELSKHANGLFRKNENEAITKFLVKYKSKEISKLLDDLLVQTYLGVNKYNNISYYTKERFEKLIDWLTMIVVLKYVKKDSAKLSQRFIEKNIYICGCLKNLSEKSGYMLEDLRSIFNFHKSKTKSEVKIKRKPGEQ